MNNAETFLFGFKISLVQTVSFKTWVRWKWFFNKIFLQYYLHQPFFIEHQNFRASRSLEDHTVNSSVLPLLLEQNSEAKIIKNKGYLVNSEFFFQVKLLHRLFKSLQNYLQIFKKRLGKIKILKLIVFFLYFRETYGI